MATKDRENIKKTTRIDHLEDFAHTLFSMQVILCGVLVIINIVRVIVTLLIKG